MENHRAVSYSNRDVIRRKNAPKSSLFLPKGISWSAGWCKGAECFTTHFPNVRVHWHRRIKACSKVSHHLNEFDWRFFNCNLVDMNLGHLLTGSYDSKLVLGVIYQKTVREPPSTDISNTVLDIPQRTILRRRWVRPKRKIDLSVGGVTVCALGRCLCQSSWINQQRILRIEPVPDSFPVVLLTQSWMQPICNSLLEFSAFNKIS